jgi:superfamily II DNA/RNA helicase
LKQLPLKEGKRLIFTQYADTADYLYRSLNPGGKADDIEVIYSGDKSKAKIVGRFAPKANPEYRLDASVEFELMTLIATDVLAEGLNLQDCDKIVNYDLHWNPVRLIQRFGRIDRIGSDFDSVYGFNFLPELGIERNLGLHQRLQNRIQEIHDTIGEDSKILDRTEQLNEEAMYAIYDKKALGSESLEYEDGDEFLDLNEAEEILRQLRSENPAEYDRIANLRDGIRTAKPGEQKGLFVFCQAGRYQQLFLLDCNGEIVSRDIPRVLGTVKCAPELQGQALSDGYNAAVMRVKRIFDEEVKQRDSERQHSLSLTLGQRYVMRELSILFRASEDEDQKGQITLLEKAFRNALTKALQRELNLLRRNGVTGQALFRSLVKLYEQHNLRDWLDRRNGQPQEEDYPRIVCSEALI